jgi:hypothetical protein
MSANHPEPFITRVVTEMTVREYLATQALSALIAKGMNAGDAAHAAVEYADKLGTALHNTPLPSWAPGSGPE